MLFGSDNNSDDFKNVIQNLNKVKSKVEKQNNLQYGRSNIYEQSKKNNGLINNYHTDRSEENVRYSMLKSIMEKSIQMRDNQLKYRY